MNDRHGGATGGERARSARRRLARVAPGVPAGIALTGVLLFGLVVVDWVVWYGFRLLTAESLATFFLNGVPSLCVAYGGYWLRRSDLGVERYPRVAAWCFVCLFGFLVVNLLLMVNFPAATLRANFGWARGVTIFGAVGGLVLGAVEARTVERAIVAERAAVRAEYVEAQHELLAYLNGVLRHEVLNAANVVEGYADLLIEERGDAPDDASDHLQRIRHQSRRMTEVINDVRVLIEATDSADEFTPVDVGDAVRDAVTTLHATYDGVVVDVSASDGARVAADDLLPRLFSNLLTNAVEHNDSAAPRVAVTVETTPDSVEVRVADNGPGIPESKVPALFERTAEGTGHGLGLYLVRTLARRYGGRAELLETGPVGSVFAVDLPRTSAAADREETAGGTDAQSAASAGADADVDAFVPPARSDRA